MRRLQARGTHRISPQPEDRHNHCCHSSSCHHSNQQRPLLLRGIPRPLHTRDSSNPPRSSQRRSKRGESLNYSPRHNSSPGFSCLSAWITCQCLSQHPSLPCPPRRGMVQTSWWCNPADQYGQKGPTLPAIQVSLPAVPPPPPLGSMHNLLAKRGGQEDHLRHHHQQLRQPQQRQQHQRPQQRQQHL